VPKGVKAIADEEQDGKGKLEALGSLETKKKRNEGFKKI